MCKQTHLLFGIHMHQPVDNFDWVIEKAVNECYAPFFTLMSRYPEFRFSVHCSGWLLEQIEKNYPDLFETIAKLTLSGSIEWFGAGFYEPVLSSIAPREREDQIVKLSEMITNRFLQYPRGLWLTERVWESSLVPDVARCGLRYTVMDDYHFTCAGFDPDRLDGYYTTEEGGVELALFPISQKLRYAIPFLKPTASVDAIKSFCRENDSAAIVFDDAEKFGMWPGTHEWVYDKGWLETFVRLVLEDPEIVTMTYGEYFDTYGSRGLAYLPSASYAEMGEWSLRADDTIAFEQLKDQMGHETYERIGSKFFKGGIWKNFLVKYPESNRIHKRMVELARARSEMLNDEFDEALFKLQTNDVLWHGVFGGLYLPNLRDNAYRYLIECENIRYGEQQGIFVDQNELDGHPKVKTVTSGMIARFDASYGGQLVELDARRSGFNFQNTLTRRKEAYHERLFEPKEIKETHEDEDGIDTIHAASIAVDPALREAVAYDWYLKNSFIDHVTDGSFDVGSFYGCRFREYGDFANQPAQMEMDGDSIRFVREGGIYDGGKNPTKLEKRYRPIEAGFGFSVELQSEEEGSYRYVQEHNFHFSRYDEVTLNGLAVEESGRIDRCSEMILCDGFLNQTLRLRWDQPCDLLYTRISTLSQSEQGADFTVQGISIALCFPYDGVLKLTGTLELLDV